MAQRRAAGRGRRLAWLAPVLTVAMLVGMVWLRAAGCAASDATVLDILLSLSSGVGFALLGALIVHFRPENRIGWLCVATGLLFNSLSFATDLANCGLAENPAKPVVPFVAWLTAYVGPTFLIVCLFALLPFLFPDGRFLTSRWRRAALAAIALVVFFTLVAAFLPGPLDYSGVGIVFPVDNPLGVGFLPRALGPAMQVLVFTTMIGASLLGVASLVLRWRRSTGDTRQQIKWFAYFLATAVLIQLVVFELGGVFFNEEIFESRWYDAVLFIVFTGFPVTIGVAVFKYRLYDIDIIIRRTLVYGALTVLLALVYFGSVVLLQGLVTAVGGQQSPISIVVSTLLIAALFSPLRRRVQGFIDRRFFRRKYDAEKTLAGFAASARDEVDLGDLAAELQRVVQETMEPEHVTIWLKDRGGAATG